MPKKLVVIVCPFSYPSACGIWTRVFADAKALMNNGYNVHVFSSNVVKGTKDSSLNYEEYEGVKIHRFPVKFSLGGTSMFWGFGSVLKELNPNFIHAHGYRHPHALFAVLLGKLSKKKVFLTTHAPFEKDSGRSIVLKLFDAFYDLFIGWWSLKLYSSVIRISEWEKVYIERLGINNSILIPNGIDQSFFKNRVSNLMKRKQQILYMGRLDPIKRVDWMLKAAKNLVDHKFKIVGPLSGYADFKSDLPNVEIVIKKYNIPEFIQELQKTDIYILPSIREAMPFTLLEAMSQGVFVISSNTNGGNEVIKNGFNGFIVKNEAELIEKIKYIYSSWDSILSIKENAIKTSQEYTADNSAKKLIERYNSNAS